MQLKHIESVQRMIKFFITSPSISYCLDSAFSTYPAVFFASLVGRKGGSPMAAPLWAIALWNRWSANGDSIWSDTLNEPADSPNNVTHVGSPPKLVVYMKNVFNI